MRLIPSHPKQLVMLQDSSFFCFFSDPVDDFVAILGAPDEESCDELSWFAGRIFSGTCFAAFDGCFFGGCCFVGVGVGEMGKQGLGGSFLFAMTPVVALLDSVILVVLESAILVVLESAILKCLGMRLGMRISTI